MVWNQKLAVNGLSIEWMESNEQLGRDRDVCN